jgi:hypothetical protein
VDLEQVPRGAAPREVRVQEGHREHGRRRRRDGESRATSCSFQLRTDELVGVLGNKAEILPRQPTPAAVCICSAQVGS